MARDYKSSRRSTKRGSSRGSKRTTNPSPWRFLASGFGLGLIAAMGLYLYLKPAEVAAPSRPVPNSAASPQSSLDTDAAQSGVTEPSVPPPVEAAAPTPAVKKPTTPAPVDSEFDFYRMLPNLEVVVSDENNQPVSASPSAARPKAPAQDPAKPSTYILQAGSFKKFIDADRRKAELAFKGIESNIQQVVLKESETWFRVYVGPSKDFAALENMRSDLRRANIDVLILKLNQ